MPFPLRAKSTLFCCSIFYVEHIKVQFSCLLKVCNKPLSELFSDKGTWSYLEPNMP
jgi:predicted metal-binding protein